MMLGDDDFAPASHLLDTWYVQKKKKKRTLPQSCVEKKKMMTPPFHMGIWEE